jgi:hypothetical protein
MRHFVNKKKLRERISLENGYLSQLHILNMQLDKTAMQSPQLTDQILHITQ